MPPVVAVIVNSTASAPWQVLRPEMIAFPTRHDLVSSGPSARHRRTTRAEGLLTARPSRK